MRSTRWKWLGLGALVALAVGTAVVAERRRRHWRQYDADEIRDRLHERFAGLDPDQPPSSRSASTSARE